MNSFIKNNVKSLVQLLSFWNFVLAFSSTVIALSLVLSSEIGIAVKVVAVTVCLAIAVGAVTAGIKMLRKGSNARIWAFLVNYLTFLICLIGSFQTIGFFLIFDKISEYFSRGFITLIILALGFLLRGWIKSALLKDEDNRTYRITTNIILGIIALIFIFQVNIIPIFFSLFLNLNNMVAIGFFLGCILLALVSIILHSSPFQKYFNTTNIQSEAIAGYLFLTPNLLGFLIFFAGPLLLSFFMSFFHWDSLSPDPPSFVGLGNYLEIFTLSISKLTSETQPLSQVIDGAVFSELTRFSLFGNWMIIGARDPLFWVALGNTVRYALMVVPLSVAFALVLSSILNSEIPGMKFFRVLFFIPSIAAIVGVAIVWRWLFNALVGFINYGLSQVTDFINLFMINDIAWENIQWLSNPKIALFAIAIMAVWQTVGFNTILFLAGLQSIPKSLYEASTIDGANPVQRFFKITIPMLAPTTFFVIATTMIQALQLFEQVYIATPNPETINNATLSVVFYLYQNGFERFRQGYASATAWVLFLLIFIATFYQYWRQKKADSIY